MRRSNVIFTALLISMVAGQTNRAQEISSVKIDIANAEIQCGDPAVLRVMLTFSTPPVSRFTPDTPQIIPLDGPSLRVQPVTGQNKACAVYRLPPAELAVEGETGKEYGTNLVVLYELREDGGKWQLPFGTPGTYEVAVVVNDGSTTSNAVSIIVKPFALGEKALALLGKHESFTFLLHGVNKSVETIACLEDLVKQCKGTTLAQMAAARLGLEYFEQFHAKHPSFEQFKQEYEQGQVQEPLFEKAREFLSLGAGLPGVFGIREKVLYQLARVQLVQGNYEKASSLITDLSTQFPHGEYGKRASSMSAEVKTLMDREPKPVPGERDPNRRGNSHPVMLGATIGVSVVVLASILLAGCMLVLRARRTGVGK